MADPADIERANLSDAAELLERATALIALGWSRQCWAHTADGKSCHEADPRADSWHPLGAIWLHWANMGCSPAARTHAILALQEEIGDSIVWWNAEQTKASRVIDAMRRAGSRLRERARCATTATA